MTNSGTTSVQITTKQKKEQKHLKHKVEIY